ncbi:hypothetical protein AAC387_Pa11g1816 [Persea americana]
MQNTWKTILRKTFIWIYTAGGDRTRKIHFYLPILSGNEKLGSEEGAGSNGGKARNGGRNRRFSVPKQQKANENVPNAASSDSVSFS